MIENVGVWIDHKKAIIVRLSGVEKQIQSIIAGSEKQLAGEHLEELRHNGFNSDVKEYYDRVISCLHDSASILILGPGEAKVELSVRLKGDSLGEYIAGIETAEEMTDGEIVARIREHFPIDIQRQ
ncbi:MAG: hypothetical protein WCW40_11575 [Bacteroidota bacterium]